MLLLSVVQQLLPMPIWLAAAILALVAEPASLLLQVSGETRTDCVPLSKDLITQITSGKPITSAIDLALFAAGEVQLNDQHPELLTYQNDLVKACNIQ
jgi:hypothetical protein